MALVLANAGLVGFFALQVVIGLGALALVPLLTDRADLSAPRWSVSEWWAVARIALPIAAAAVLTVIYLRVLVVLTSVLTSDYETGLFATSARIMEMLGGLALVISGVILPVASVAARDERGRLAYVLARTTETSLLLGVLIAIVLLFGARPLVIVLGGSEFAEAAPVLQTQAPAIVTIFVVQAWATFLIADHHQRDLVRCVLIGLGALFAAGLVLIPLYDAQGAAAAAVIADLVYATAIFVAVRHLRGRPTPVQLGFCGRLMVATAVAIGIGLATSGTPRRGDGDHRGARFRRPGRRPADDPGRRVLRAAPAAVWRRSRKGVT